MATFTILSGDFSGTSWRLEDEILSSGFYNTQLLPITEITEITKKEVIGKNLYVDFKLGDKYQFTAQMKEKDFKAIYEKFLKVGKNPKEKELPLTKKSTSNVIFSILGVLFLLSIFSSSSESFDATKDLTQNEKIKVCKNYIGSMFGVSPNIMRTGIIKNDDGFFAEIIYTRKVDNTQWKNMCHISGNNITWASLYDNQLGRWRFEDEVQLEVTSKTKESKTISGGNLFSLTL